MDETRTTSATSSSVPRVGQMPLARQGGSIAAVILAGGLARRMGGGDKALQVVGGRTILARTVAVLSPHAALAINANGDPARFSPYGVPVLPDPVGDRPGPLAGILAGMEWAADQGLPWLLTVPGDCPFLPADLVPSLRAAAVSGVVMAASGGRTHFVTALWPTRLRAGLRAALQASQRKVESFAAAHTVTTVDWPTTPFDPFLNVNTPEDLVEANRLALNPPSATASEAAAPRTPPPG